MSRKGIAIVFIVIFIVVMCVILYEAAQSKFDPVIEHSELGNPNI